MKPLDLEMWSFFFRNSLSLNASGNINEAHTHAPHAACFAFKNILISPFRRELNAIDRPGPFKISASISISSPNTHAASFPSGNDCPWLGEWFVCIKRARCVSCGIHSFTPPWSPLSVQRIVASSTKGVGECSTHLVWPLWASLSSPPSPGRYLFVFAMH